jgi:hypothetical protein
MLYMEANCHPFFGLAAEEDALDCFLKSLLMLASSFLVGILFSSSRFCFASIGGAL